ncbi:HET-domain-containing protein, partial [Hyaloscypha variabilis F]
FLPSRLIDVGLRDGSEEPRLLVGPQGDIEYLTLSHCWGKTPFIRTLQRSLYSFQVGIPWNDLKLIFQEAISITRRLGHKYLWIDSLCIVQDDPEDLQVECSKMADIYRNSYLAIAASASRDGSLGCFLPETYNPPLLELGIARSQETSTGYHLGFRTSIEGFEAVVDAGTLNSRGWTLQERLLSPRILYCAPGQKHWECLEHRRSQTRSTADTKVRYRELRTGKCDSGIALHLSWYELIRGSAGYSGRTLTNQNNKLPALSSLAYNFARRTRNKYATSLWERNLVVGLLWFVAKKRGVQSLGFWSILDLSEC